MSTNKTLTYTLSFNADVEHAKKQINILQNQIAGLMKASGQG